MSVAATELDENSKVAETGTARAVTAAVIHALLEPTATAHPSSPNLSHVVQ